MALAQTEVDFEIEESWREGLKLVRDKVTASRHKHGYTVETALQRVADDLIGQDLYTRIRDDAKRCGNRKWHSGMSLSHPSEDPGYVYLMYSDDRLFKIGKSKRPSVRVKEIRAMVPMRIGIVWGTLTDSITCWERNLHIMFDHRRQHGEWFKLSFWDVAYIISWETMFLSRPQTDDNLTNCLNDIARNYEVPPVLNTRDVPDNLRDRLEHSIWPNHTLAPCDPFEAPDFF